MHYTTNNFSHPHVTLFNMYSVSLLINFTRMPCEHVKKLYRETWIVELNFYNSMNSFCILEKQLIFWYSCLTSPLYIHVCYKQLILMCNVIYFVKGFWSSNFIYICFITLYSISGLTAYKEFHTSVSNNWTALSIFPMLPRFWILQLCQPNVFNLNSRIWDKTVRSEVCIWQAKENEKQANTNYSSPLWPLVLCTGCV